MRIVNSSELTNKFFEYRGSEDIDIVKQILKDVKNEGDKAVKRYTEKFDNVKLKSMEVSRTEVKEAYNQVDEDTILAIKKAARNIASFAERQHSQLRNFETKKGKITIGQRVVPIERVGCYIPGGRYPLASSALMSIIPAKIAGVNEIIACSPKIAPATIAAADIAGADRIFNIGGVQAIGSMAYGTETIPKVNKIIGPGNKYVTAAKKEVYGTVGIDFIAGPSEVLIISDETGNPEFIAADLLAQAEHDPDARADMITTSKKLAKEVNKQLELQLPRLKTKETAKLALENGIIILVNSLEEAARIANRRAPEHLELQVKNPEELANKLRNYGALFIGKYSAEVFADYCSGTNHILPTNGAAHYTGGLSVKDFVKLLTYEKIDKEGCAELIDTTSKLAETEGLDAHKKAAEIRKPAGNAAEEGASPKRKFYK